MNNILTYQDQVERKNFRLDQTNYRYWTKKEMLDKPQYNYGQIL